MRFPVSCLADVHRMTKLVLLIAASLLATGACTPGNGAESGAPSANTADQSDRADDALSQPPQGDIAPGATAGPATDAGAEAVLQACLRQQAGPSPASEKPPVNAKGLYANKGECRGCATGWWHTTEPATLYVAPDREAAQVMSVPAGMWLYALETVSLNAPSRGVVVKSGGNFNRCDVVYHVYTSFEEGESWDTVWHQGEPLTYEEGGDAAIQWLEPLPFVDLYKDDGWWVRLRGRNGEAGWAWATARDNEFACKWQQDPEDICASAPAERLSGQ
jgi:hypothetical protein